MREWHRSRASIAPDLEIHGSTQMSITSAEGVAFAQRLGVNRVTLARELSLAEIRRIRALTDCELEIFVHGALCVAYSGQCFSSEAWGGRSANRGQCAQACRLPYEMFVDGQLQPLGDARYLLSPGDLYALRQIPEIVEIGISALKIEGRYKDADYVALATRAYRKAVDEAWAGREQSVTPAEELQLEQVYSRGLGAYFLTGTNHQAVVDGRSPAPSRRADGPRGKRARRRGAIGALRGASASRRSSPATAWSSTPRIGAVPRSRKRAAAFTASRPAAATSNCDSETRPSTSTASGKATWSGARTIPNWTGSCKPFLEPAAPRKPAACRRRRPCRPGTAARTVWTLVEHPEMQVDVRIACAAWRSAEPRAYRRSSCAINWAGSATRPTNSANSS